MKSIKDEASLILGVTIDSWDTVAPELDVLGKLDQAKAWRMIIMLAKKLEISEDGDKSEAAALEAYAKRLESTELELKSRDIAISNRLKEVETKEKSLKLREDKINETKEYFDKKEKELSAREKQLASKKSS